MEIKTNEFVKGTEVAKFSKLILNIYSILHILGTIFGLSLYLESLKALQRYYYSNDEIFITLSVYAFISFAALVIIYTISNLLIQLYANTVATREAVYYYINKQLEEKE